MEDDKRARQARFWLEYSHELSGAIRYQEALAAIEQALALERADPAIWYARGTYLGMLGRYTEALDSFTQALQLVPEYVPAWDGKAWALHMLKRNAEALQAVERALSLDPDYFDAIKRKRRLIGEEL